jgi:hypothetical protein
MTKNNSVNSTHARFGRRTFFFDVNVTPEGKKYLKVTESRFVEEGKPRIYNSFVLFPTDVALFQKRLSEAVSVLQA